MTTPHVTSYDDIPDFGALYDSVPAYAARTDAAFYADVAVSSGGPVLELGCGTGRILLPIAHAGIPITGLDESISMLARLRAKLDDESTATRESVTLRHGNASNFDLATTFPLIIAPFRVMQHMITIEQQLGCLTAVARHLTAGGTFVFDVFNPYFHSLVKDRSAESEDTPAFVTPDGRTLRRTARIGRVRWTEQVSETELIYYVTERGESQPRRYVQQFDMRWYLRAELIHLLARAGLSVQTIYGNFDRSALTDEAPEQVVVAVKV